MEYITRYKLTADGRIEELRVPKKEALELIARLLHRDREMLEILAKL